MANNSEIVLGGICVIRNEADIIERFVRHNLKYLDFLVCVNNESQDSTLDILAALKQEGLPMEIFAVAGVAHPQVFAANTVADHFKDQCDVLFFLDADEFIIPDSLESLRAFCFELMAQTKVGLIDWALGIPDLSVENSTTLTLDSVLYSEQTHRKICVPTLFWQHNPQLSVSAGFHGLVGLSAEQYAIAPNIFLLHLPIRSIPQFILKCVQGELALKLNPKRGKMGGYHWRYIYNLYRANQDITIDAIVELASNCYLQASLIDCEILPLEPFQAIETTEILHSNQVSVDLTHSINQQLLSTIEFLEKTKFASKTARVGQTEYGVVCYDFRDTVIGQSLELYGEWAAEELKLLQAFIRPADVAIDVGANVGIHTVRFAQLVGQTGVVYAFEPQRLIFQKLCATISLNDLENVFVFPYGLGDTNQNITVNSIYSGNLGNFSIEAQQVQQGDAIIEIKTLDSFGLNRCNLIKIDVEGMEESVLAGAWQTIARHRPILYLENNIFEKSESLLGRIFSAGYDCWWHISPYFNPDNFYHNSVNLFAGVSRPEINMLCLPQEWHVENLSLPKVSSAQEKWTDVITM